MVIRSQTNQVFELIGMLPAETSVLPYLDRILQVRYLDACVSERYNCLQDSGAIFRSKNLHNIMPACTLVNLSLPSSKSHNRLAS